MKKLLSLTLALAIIICAIPLGTFTFTASAATSGTTGDCTWRLDGTVLTISGNGAMDNYSYPMLPWGRDITKVIIENGVTSIGNAAFYECTNLTSVTIPDSIISIGSSVFSYCTSLTNIDVSENNTNYCSIDGVLFDKNITTLIQYATGKTDTSYLIPDGVTSIKNGAFANGKNLINITIPESVISIGGVAFSNCTSLDAVTIPDDVTSIGDFAFQFCSSLTNVIIGDSVTSIAQGTFYDCTGLTSVTIPDNVTNIGRNAFFACNNLTIYGYAGSYAESYANENNITFVAIDDDNEKYYTYTVENGEATITGVEQSISGDIIVPSTLGGYPVKSISNYSLDNPAFAYCTNLTSVTIPDSITSIGALAFYGCTSLTSVTIGNGVISIGRCAFEQCNNLTSVTLGDSVTNIEKEAFLYCYNLANIYVSDNNPNYCSIDGVLFNKDITTIIQHPIGKTYTSYIIPNSVTSIGNYAFWNCYNLISVKIPDSVISIGNYAFEYCTSLTNITIPDSVTSIGNYAFYDCISLTSITIPNSVTSIGDWVFSGCTSLTSITIGSGVTSMGSCAFYECTSLTSVTIRDGVKSIGDSAFWDCDALAEITIPSSVTSIGENAFGECNEHLTICGYTGSCAETYANENNIQFVALDGESEEYYGSWTITPDKTGIYTFDAITSQGTSEIYNIIVFDKEGNEVKYNETQKGWPLVAGQIYTIKLKEDNPNIENIDWALNYEAGTIFPDTQASAWYNDAVTYAVGAGIMSGYSNGKFGTSDSIQRQDFLVMLARLDGADLDDYKGYSLFPDVARNSYYEAAVNWGAENGIVTGYQNGEFGVGDKVTREQLVTFLYRYAKYKGYDYSYTSNREAVVSGQYKDYKKVSGFAKEPILWAIEKGVISGKTPITIAPQGNAQRCEVAKIMYNIYLNDIFK